MFEQISSFAQQRPYTSGLIAIGAGALIWFAVSGGGSGGSGSSGTLDNSGSGLLYTRPSDAEIQAAAQIQSSQVNAQRASEDAQIAAVLASKQLDYGFDAERLRIANENAKIVGANQVAKAQVDVAAATAANQYAIEQQRISTTADVTKYDLDTSYKGLTYQTDAAYKAMVYQTDAAINAKNIDADVQKRIAELQVEENKRIAELAAINNVNTLTIGGNNAVRLADAQKKTSFSVGIPGFGSLGVSF